MRKYFILSLLFVLAMALCAPPASAQSSGSVKGICTDSDGKPIAQGTVEWIGLENAHKFTLKTNNKGEYFSLGVFTGDYDVKLSKDGKEIFKFNKVHVGLEEKSLDFNMMIEQANSAKAQGKTPEQIKAEEELKAKAAKEHNTIAALNDKIKLAGLSIDAGDYDAAIATLNDANQIDSTRDPIWALLGDAYRLSGPKQTDSDEKLKRYDMAIASYQKAIDMRSASEQAKKETDNNQKLAGYYNNLADAYAKSNKTADAVANYNKAIAQDPAHQAKYLFNEGAIFTNTGKVDEAIAAFDKVIAADPTRASAYYWKGVNLLGKATLKGDKMIAPDGTAEAFQKYLDLEPNGQFAEAAKGMLTSIGATVETGFGTKKKPPKK